MYICMCVCVCVCMCACVCVFIFSKHKDGYQVGHTAGLFFFYTGDPSQV